MEDIRRRKEKMKGKSEGDTNHERVWTPRNKLRVSERRVSPVMGIKEGTYCREHWVLYASNESWNTISKTNEVLYDD